MIEKFKSIQAFLIGKKSYILFGFGILTTGMWLMGWVPDEVAIPILTSLNLGSIVTLKAAIGRK